jgi:hypothetical protein
MSLPRTRRNISPELEESTKSQFGVALALCLSLITVVISIAGMAAYSNWDTIQRLLA